LRNTTPGSQSSSQREWWFSQLCHVIRYVVTDVNAFTLEAIIIVELLDLEDKRGVWKCTPKTLSRGHSCGINNSAAIKKLSILHVTLKSNTKKKREIRTVGKTGSNLQATVAVQGAVFSISLDPLRSTWLACELQQTPQ
jgi:hypothetical protein